MKQYVVYIGDDYRNPHSETGPLPHNDALAVMWAYAKHPQGETASLFNGESWITNKMMKTARPPSYLQEKIDYWAAIHFADDPEQQLEQIIVALLNSGYDQIIKNDLNLSPKEFISVIANTAKEWAEDCYQI